MLNHDRHIFDGDFLLESFLFELVNLLVLQENDFLLPIWLFVLLLFLQKQLVDRRIVELCILRNSLLQILTGIWEKRFRGSARESVNIYCLYLKGWKRLLCNGLASCLSLQVKKDGLIFQVSCAGIKFLPWLSARWIDCLTSSS